MPSTIAKGRIATNQSGHTAPGQPGISPGPPTPPAGPVPTPYPYMAKSNDLQRGGTNGKSLDVSGKALLVGACMKIVPPNNNPAMVIGIGDVVTTAKNMWGAVMTGEEDARAEGKKIAVTGSDVALNALMPEQQVVQVRTKFLNAVDFDAMMKDGSLYDWIKKNAKVFGDPVSATTGAVVDWDFDLALPGVAVLVWERRYTSAFRKKKTPLGKGGWTHAYHQWIGEDDGRLVWWTGEGRRITLPAIAPRGAAFLRREQIEVQADASGGYVVRDVTTGQAHVFAPLQPKGKPAMLREVRDAYGNRVELRYDDDERLVTVVDAARREVRLLHDAKGRIAALEVWAAAELRQRVDYGYTPDGELGEVKDAAGHVTRYEYDGKHRLTAKHLADGPTFRYAYDEEGDDCVRAWSDEGFHPVRFEHRPGERAVTVCGTPAPREIAYDERCEVLSEATPDGSWAQKVERDEDGLVTKRIDAAGEETIFELDERGHCVARTDAAGRTTKWEIQGDRAVKEIDPAGRVTIREYDGRGGLVRVELPSGAWVGLERDGFGRVVAAYFADGRFATYTYDEAHNLVKETDARGAVTAYEHDALGRLVARTDAEGTTVRIENDVLGRPITFSYADGTTERYAWDAQNRVLSIEDRRRKTWTLSWTGTRSIKKITDPDGKVWELEVDVMERLVGVTSPRAERYDLRYDRAGRIREEITFDGSLFSRHHDRSGRLSRVDLPGEAWLSYEYDAAGDVVEEDSPHGKRTFVWDATGRALEGVVHDYDRRVGVAFERDAAGRVIAEAQGARVIRFAYDKHGRLAERVLPGGQTTKYFYDLSGDLVALDHAGHKVAIQRDAFGREVRRHHYSGAIDVLRAFNRRARTMEQWVSARPDPARVTSGAAVSPARRRWTYDADGRPIDLLDARWGRTGYVYGSVDQLLAVEGRFGARYDHDPSGALIGAAGHTDEVIAPWRTREGNVLLRSATHEYAYDAARRRRKKIPLSGGAPTLYRWDARSRLREVHLPSGEKVCFWYDAFGRRTLKLIVPPTPPLSALGSDLPKPRAVEYLWHGFTLAAEIDSERGTRVFVHDPSTMFPILHVEDDHVFAYVTEPTGTPRELIDEAGKIAWAAAISPFGKVLETYRDPAARPASTPFRQLGHVADEETGLLCTLHRYFDPEVARWLSIDPLHLAAGGDLFGLTKSPTLAVDPFGLGEYDVQPYRDPNPGVERHEPLQNSWLKEQGFGGRRMNDLSLDNPTIGLSKSANGVQGQHAEVHATVNAELEKMGKRPGELPADDLIDLHAKAMKKAGIPQDKIDEVIAQAKKHAPKFVCS